jgi:hypothetical protein
MVVALLVADPNVYAGAPLSPRQICAFGELSRSPSEWTSQNREETEGNQASPKCSRDGYCSGSIHSHDGSRPG